MKLPPPSVLRAGKALALLGLIFLLGSQAPAAARPGQLEAGAGDSLFVRFPPFRIVPSGIAACVSHTFLRDSDLDDTYGTIRTYGLRGKIRVGEGSELMLGVAYGRARGDPYHSEDFQSGKWARMSLLPIELGFCFQHPGPDPPPIFFGLTFTAARISERNPAFRSSVEEATPSLSAWRPGYRLFLGYEWYRRIDGRALGLELSLGNQRYLTRDSDDGPGPGSTSVAQFAVGVYLAKRIDNPPPGAER